MANSDKPWEEFNKDKCGYCLGSPVDYVCECKKEDETLVSAKRELEALEKILDQVCDDEEFPESDYMIVTNLAQKLRARLENFHRNSKLSFPNSKFLSVSTSSFYDPPKKEVDYGGDRLSQEDRKWRDKWGYEDPIDLVNDAMRRSLRIIDKLAPKPEPIYGDEEVKDFAIALLNGKYESEYPNARKEFLKILEAVKSDQR